MNTALLSCPFCAGEAEKCEQSAYDYGHYYILIQCKDCKVSTRSAHVGMSNTKTKNDEILQRLVDSWNRRV